MILSIRRIYMSLTVLENCCHLYKVGPRAALFGGDCYEGNTIAMRANDSLIFIYSSRATRIFWPHVFKMNQSKDIFLGTSCVLVRIVDNCNFIICYEWLMNAKSKSSAARWHLCIFTIFSMLTFDIAVTEVSYARRYERALWAYLRTRSNVKIFGAIDSSILACRCFATWSVWRLKCIFDLPQEYSTPTPASSGWHFGDISARWPCDTMSSWNAVSSVAKSQQFASTYATPSVNSARSCSELTWVMLSDWSRPFLSSFSIAPTIPSTCNPRSHSTCFNPFGDRRNLP